MSKCSDKNNTILVVEDELPLQNAIKIKLEKNDIKTVAARTVEQALGYLEDVPGICAVWLDHYLLGKEDGLDFVAKVKNNVKFKNIPIFVVSNTATPAKVKTYLEFGVNKYYVKSEKRLDVIIDEIKKSLGIK